MRYADPRLAIIVPVYGNWDDTRECVRALTAQATDRCTVYLADDGSPDAPPADVREMDGVVYRRGPHVGFGPNCNRAAAEALEDGATHCLFLNSDTLPGPRFIEAWLRAADQHPHAILSPIIYCAEHATRVWHSGGTRSIWAPFIRQRHRFDEPTKVDLVTGCCLMVPAYAWDCLGGFDEAFTMYFEDYDLALRASEAGIDVLVLPDADLSVRHKGSRSFRHDWWEKDRLLLRGRRRFIRRHYSGPAALACRMLEAPHLLSRVIANLPALPDSATVREVVRPGH